MSRRRQAGREPSLRASAWTAILGISFVVGSGPNSFIGGAGHAVDFQGGFSDNYNFKAVPEPVSMLALGLGAAASARKRPK